MSRARKRAQGSTTPRPSWQTDRYILSLHRAIYMATGDESCRYAARPGDDLIRSLRILGRSVRESMKVMTPAPATVG